MIRDNLKKWLSTPNVDPDKLDGEAVDTGRLERERQRRNLEAQMEEMIRVHYRQQEAERKDRAVPRSDAPPVTELPGQGRCVGYVIARRAWQVDLVQGLLTSQYDTTWLPGEPVRAREPSYPTTAGYGAGIYGMKLHQPPEELPTFDGRGQNMIAYGLVALWGRVKEHAKGYRAEWAYPLEIKRLNFDGPFHDALLAAVNERYGCRPHKEEAPVRLTSPSDALFQLQQQAAMLGYSHAQKRSLNQLSGTGLPAGSIVQFNSFNPNTGGP